jgi:hypothetical protein
MPNRPSRVLTVLCAALIVATGCVSKKEEDVKQVSHADARTLVETYAQQVATTIGNDQDNDLEVLPNPCDGKRGELSDTVYSMTGHAQIPVPEAEQLPTLARLRDQWTQQGYTITEDRTFPDGTRGTLVARTPTDDVRIRVQSTNPAVAFALMISTPCYQSDEPH